MGAGTERMGVVRREGREADVRMKIIIIITQKKKYFLKKLKRRRRMRTDRDR